MPLRGKIVVIKRSGGDGTEFPLTTTCLFGRKPDCDIRIQLPQVSKEHCRIDFNENKEVFLTNLSLVNPTRVNGKVLQQSERLKHGDVITVIDRSFRFECPPAATPKKRSSRGGELETLKVLQDQQVGDKGEKRVSEVSTDPLKDGTNNNNIQQPLEKTQSESQEAGRSGQSNSSPFNDLYQMIKRSLDVKTPGKSSASLLQTPSSKFCSPVPGSVRKTGVKHAVSSDGSSSHKKNGVKVEHSATPPSAKKERKSSPAAAGDQAASPRRRTGVSPEKFTVSEVIEQITQTARSPVRRRSKEASPAKPSQTKEEAEQLQTASPRSSVKGKGDAKKRKSGKLGPDPEAQQSKRKRVSFGGHLSPELFDKRLPPDSPLRRGATPRRRSLSLLRPKQSLLRRASVIGMLKESPAKMALPKTPTPEKKGQKNKSSSPKAASPKAATPSTKSASSSPKAATPGKKSPKSGPSSPKSAAKTPKSASLSLITTPAKKSPKSGSPSPKSATKLPKSASSSPKAATPGKKSPKSGPSSPKSATKPKSASTSPKAATPATKTPKPASSSPKTATKSPKSATKTPKSASSSPNRSTPAKKSPKSGPSSPKSATKTPKSASLFPITTPAKKSPKSASLFPITTPAKKSPKSGSLSPKSATKPPKSASSSPKAATPAKKSPKSAPSSAKSTTKPKSAPSPPKSAAKSASSTPKAATPKSLPPAGRTSSDSRVPSMPVQGRFSVSRIATPSPVAESDAVTKRVSPVAATPKLRLERKSMKSTSKKTPRLSKSAVKVLQRRSGVSRASLKVSSCWADIVKFGKPKPQVAQPRAKINKKTVKKTASKPQQKTPARKPKGHVSTGHADSPATVVVGRAHKRTAIHPTGAAPRVIANVALLKRNMRMDEDLSGISEMFQTPVGTKRSAGSSDGDTERSAGHAASVLNTPEEPGEMAVSPMSLASVVKGRRYNSEAVQRLLNGDEESSFIIDPPALQIESDGADLKAVSLKTPKQRPEIPECLGGVKRILKTPKHKPDAVEDLRGRLLKTPRQKPEQRECLTGVKRLVKTPREKADAIEDLRGKILKTPKQKPEQVECLSAVKRILKTPRQKAAPVDDIRGKLLRTPKQKPEEEEEEECLSALKRVFESPHQEESLKTPEAPPAAHLPSDGAEDVLEASPTTLEPQQLSEATETPHTKTATRGRLTGIKRLMKTPREKSAPVEDLVGVKRIMRTPKERGQPVQDHFGLKRLMRSPRLRGNAPVEDFQGLKELMEEPLTEAETRQEQCGPDGVRELELQPPSEESSAVNVYKHDVTEVIEVVEHGVDLQSVPDVPAPSNGEEIVAEHNLILKPPADENVEETVQEGSPAAPVRGRRGRKAGAAAPPAVRQTKRGKNKDAEIVVEDTPVSAEPVQPRRGRNARKVQVDAESEKNQAAGAQVVHHEAPEKLAAKPKRGRKAKQPEPSAPEQQDGSPADDPEEPKTDVGDESQNESEINKPTEEDEAPAEAEGSAAVHREESSSSTGQKKSVRGRRGKQTEPEEKQEAAEEPVRARRGRKAEAAAPPVARQTRRGRSTKMTEEEAVVEETPAAVVKPKRGRNARKSDQVVPEAESEQNRPAGAEAADAPEKLAAKPKRGRKVKQPEPSAPGQQDDSPADEPDEAATKPDVIEEFESPAGEAAPEAESSTTGQKKSVRGKRGRQTEAEGKQEAAEEPVRGGRRAVQAAAPPAVRQVRRGRNAKTQEVVSGQPAESEKTGPPEPQAEVRSVDGRRSEEALEKPQTVSEAAAAKPRRGQKAKQEAPSVPIQAQEENPKRGRRGRPAAKEEEAATQNKMAAEETGSSGRGGADSEPMKPRARTSAKRELPHVVPVKRARRGAAPPLEETGESTAEQITSGRRKVKSSEESSSDQQMKKLSKSVRWKSEMEMVEIPKTAVRAGRGRRSKVEDKVDGESQDLREEAERTEEDLSGKTVDAPPVKRARRGAKVADDDKPAETPLKPRRGRAAKK